MKSIWRRRKEKQERQHEQSVQTLIPVRALDGGIIVTNDFRLVQLLRVSSINLDLMSHRELNEAMNKYEMFLRSLSFPVQTTIMSQPVDLGGYVKSLEAKQVHADTVKQDLLRGYIAYAKGIETSTAMIQRQRYLMIAEPVAGKTKQSYEESMMELDQKKKQVKSGLEEMGLTVHEAHDLDIARYLHTLFDYAGSQHRPIEDTFIVPYTVGGKNA
ncbi:hypothetical protein [Bacillus sp. 165]|uniref:hypothetical protein n=1 Tax=Bacillus sp. 165 TaxID=1529117 RepID=UPI001ADC9461|nr:hypothetical protein [Bacillus sp. 165]MBO9128970.1 hypothetical protein [Bacillus sp. 165]